MKRISRCLLLLLLLTAPAFATPTCTVIGLDTVPPDPALTALTFKAGQKHYKTTAADTKVVQCVDGSATSYLIGFPYRVPVAIRPAAVIMFAPGSVPPRLSIQKGRKFYLYTDAVSWRVQKDTSGNVTKVVMYDFNGKRIRQPIAPQAALRRHL